MKVILKGGKLGGRVYERLPPLSPSLVIQLVASAERLEAFLWGEEIESVAEYKYDLTFDVIDGMPVYSEATAPRKYFACIYRFRV